MVLQNSNFCSAILIVTVASGALLYIYPQSCINPIVPVLQVKYNETYFKRNQEALDHSTWNLLLSLSSSSHSVGAFTGSLLTNTVLKYLNRKRSMILLHVVSIIGSLISAIGAGVASSYEAVIVGKFILGLAPGIGLNVLPLIVAETCAPERRAMYTSITGVFSALGLLLGPTVAHPKVLGSVDLWHFVFAATIVPSLLYLLPSYWFSDTISNVLNSGGEEKALNLLRRMRTSDHSGEKFEVEIQLELENIKKEIALCKTQNSGKTETYLSIFKHKQFRMQLFGVAALYSIINLDGINHLIVYSDYIFIRGGISAEHVTYATIGSMAIAMLGTLLGTLLISKFGAKKTIMGMTAVAAVGHALITISLSTSHLNKNLSYISIAGAALVQFGCFSGPVCCIWPLAVAITIDATRSKILSLCGCLLWTISITTSFIPPYLFDALGAYSFLIWAGLCSSFIVYCKIFIPETHRKTSEEIQDKLC